MNLNRASWNVMHREGWCIASKQAGNGPTGLNTAGTLCGMVVALPWGISKFRACHVHCTTCKDRWRARTETAPPARDAKDGGR